jgi:hypothetical protein
MPWALGFGLWALGFGLWALGFGLWALGFGLWALGLGRVLGQTHRIHFWVGVGDARDDAGVKCRCSQFFAALQFTGKKIDQDRKRTFRLSRRYLESPLVVFLDEK